MLNQIDEHKQQRIKMIEEMFSSGAITAEERQAMTAKLEEEEVMEVTEVQQTFAAPVRTASCCRAPAAEHLRMASCCGCGAGCRSRGPFVEG